MLLCASVVYGQDCKFRTPRKVIHGGGGTDCNGITWFVRNMKSKEEMERRKEYKCTNGYIDENDAYCFYPEICPECRVWRTGCLNENDYIDTSLGCANFTVIYKELLKKPGRFACVIE